MKLPTFLIIASASLLVTSSVIVPPANAQESYNSQSSREQIETATESDVFCYILLGRRRCI